MQASVHQWRTHHLFEVRIDAMMTDQVLRAVDDAVETRSRLLIGMVNAAKMVMMRRDEGLRRAVLGADLILADGMSIVWSCRLFGLPIPERVTGIDLMEAVLKRCHERHYRVYCLGATDAVIGEIRCRIEDEYAGAVLVGARNGYYTADDEEAVAKEIAKARPDVLFVGMSSPRKEKFLAHWSSTLGVPVCHGVGGAFDVMAGKVRRAPRLWQALGMEWAYRVWQEPKRLCRRYLFVNTVFVGMVAMEAARGVRRWAIGSPASTSPVWRRIRTSHQ